MKRTKPNPAAVRPERSAAYDAAMKDLERVSAELLADIASRVTHRDLSELERHAIASDYGPVENLRRRVVTLSGAEGADAARRFARMDQALKLAYRRRVAAIPPARILPGVRIYDSMGSGGGVVLAIDDRGVVYVSDNNDTARTRLDWTNIVDCVLMTDVPPLDAAAFAMLLARYIPTTAARSAHKRGRAARTKGGAS